MASEKARKAAARKRATVRAQERTRRTMRTPGRTVEQGVGWGNIARGVARLAGSAAKASGKAGRPAANAGSRAAKQAAKKTAPAAKRTPGRRTAQTPQWAKTYGSKKPSEVTIKMSARDKAQTQRLQKLMKDKKAKAASKTKTQRNVAVGTASGVGAAGIAGGAAMQYKNRRPKGRMPIRPKKK